MAKVTEQDLKTTTDTIQYEHPQWGYINEHGCIILTHLQAYRFGLKDLRSGDRLKLTMDGIHVVEAKKYKK